MVLESATILALVAALCIALQALTVESGAKTVRRTTGGSSALTAAVISVIVSLILFITILLIRGIIAETLVTIAIISFIIAGILDPFILRLAYFEGIDRAGARISALILAINPAVAALIAVPFLGETLTIGLAVGIGFIVLGGGLLLSSRDDEDDDDLLLRELAQVEMRAILFPIVAMASLAISVVLIKFGLERVPDPVLAATVAQAAALVGFIMILLSSQSARANIRTPNARANSLFTLAGGFIAVGLLSMYVALDVGSVVRVVPIVNTYPLLVVVFSYILVRQVPHAPRAIAGIVAIVTGGIFVELFAL